MSADLFIPCAPKDTVKLPFVLQSVDLFLPEVNAVHICTPQPIEPLSGYRFTVEHHLDRDVLPFDYNRFKFRPTWVYQQFLKLFQGVTQGEFYLVMDADKIINRSLLLFDNGQPIMYLPTKDQNHGPYYEYSKAMLGIRRVHDHSFLSEVTLYNRNVIQEMLDFSARTVADWLNESVRLIDATCVIGDAELYGNFAAQHHPNLYQYRMLIDEQRGKYDGDWCADELVQLVNEMSGRDVDVVSVHSWHD